MKPSTIFNHFSSSHHAVIVMQSASVKKREGQIVLSLNVNLFNTAKAQPKPPETLDAIKHILGIPEDAYFKEHWHSAYPLWLIHKDFEKKQPAHHFKIMDSLVWALLRLRETYKTVGFDVDRASLKEAIEQILGDQPLKSKHSEQDDYLCGEKGYGKHFKAHKEICHFMAAFAYIEREEGTKASSLVSLWPAHQIERFLRLSHWFREHLLIIKTPNVKKQHPVLKRVACPAAFLG